MNATAPPPVPERLYELLELLCEDRLAAAETDELERLVLSDAAARSEYLHYLQLHGDLWWDAAVGDGECLADSPTAALPALDGEPVRAAHEDRTTRLARYALPLVAAAAVVFVAVGWWLGRTSSRTVPVAAAPTNDAAETDATGPTSPGTEPGDGERVAAQSQRDAAGTTPRPSPTPMGTLPGFERAPGDASTAAAGSTRSVGAPRTTAETHGSGTSHAVDSAVASGNAGSEPTIGSGTETIVAFVDRQLEAAWLQAGVQPSPEADDHEWLRRVTLDLAGRIPTRSEIAEFTADDSPRKHALRIDRLLDSSDFSRHWGTVWTNLLVGRSAARGADRDRLQIWLNDAFARNRPWNEVVRDLVAAEGNDGPAQFLIAHLNDQAVPATAHTARLVLGVQVQCTQCHDHPFNDWKQDRFWELNSFFAQAAVERTTEIDPRTGRRSTERVLVDRPIGGPTAFETRRAVMRVAFPRFEGRTVDPGAETKRRAALADLLFAGPRPQAADAFVNRLWSQFFGAGFVQPVDDMGPHNPATHPALLERLAREFAASGYDVRQAIRWTCLSRAYRATSRETPENAEDDPFAGRPPLFTRTYVKTMSPEQAFDSLLVAARPERVVRGDWNDADERRRQWLQQFVVPRGTEENDESAEFGGTIPQALLLMNGELTAAALDPARETVLHEVAAAREDETAKIRRLALAALCREPTEPEIAVVRQAIRARQARRMPKDAAVLEGLQDLFWAYLNSNEFIHIH